LDVVTFRMRDFDIPVRGNWLTLKCKEQGPHESNTDEENNHGAADDAEFAVRENSEEETEKRDFDQVDNDRVAQLIHPDWAQLVWQ
jgi:hypothetical protein